MAWLRPVLLVCCCLTLISCSDDEPSKPSAEKPAATAQATKDKTTPQQPQEAIPLYFQVLNVSSIAHKEGLAAKVVLSQPLDPKTNNSPHLTVEDSKGHEVKGEWILDTNPNTLLFVGLQPEQKYSVFVEKTLTSVTGKTLDQTTRHEITAPAMVPVVGFASSGSLLPAPVKKGLPVMSVNIPEVDIDFFRVKPDHLSEFFKQYQQRASIEIYYLEKLKPFLELAHSGRFDLKTKANTRAVSHIPVQSLSPLTQPGIYLAVMRAKGDYQYQYPATYFTISDLGVHARSYSDRLDVWVNSLQTGQSKASANVYLLDKQGVRISDLQNTDNKGHVSFAKPIKNAYLLVAEHEQHTSVVPLFTPALDLANFKLGKRQQQPHEVFIYTPRDLYRPGEQIDFSALLRGTDGQTVKGFPLQADIIRPDGKVLNSFTWRTEQQNYFQHAYTIPANAPTGRWQLKVTTPSDVVFQYDFLVEDFLPERMKLDLGAPSQQPTSLTANDALSVPVEGDYLYGAPAAGNEVQPKVWVRSTSHPLSQWPDYHFGITGYDAFNQRQELSSLKLDADGKGRIDIKNEWQETQSPLAITVSASLLESGGRPVTRNRAYHVFPHPTLVGIRPLFKDDNSDSDSLVSFEVVKTNQEGELQTSPSVQAKLIREERHYNWHYSESSGWDSSYTVTEYATYEQPLALSADGPTKLQVPVKYGHYRLEVTDPSSQQVSSYRFYAGWQQAPDSDSRPDQIQLTLDKKAYLAGDNIQVTVNAPFAGQGYLLVEGNQPLWWDSIEVPAEGKTFTIPVSDDWDQHNLYVSAVVIQPGKEHQLIRRAVGVQHLPLDRSQRELSIAINAPDKIIPNSQLTAKLKLTGINSDQPTQVTVAAVDVGVLNITRYETPNPNQWFFGQRRYEVSQYDLYQKIIQPESGSIAELMFGGDADLTRGGQQPASDVQIVSLFSGPVTVNDQGEAEVNFAIPEFNGQVRLMAVAFNDHQYGHNEQAVTVAAPVVTQLAMPRFLANNDESTLALDIHNLSEQNQALSLEFITSNGLSILKDTLPEKLSLEKGEKQTLRIPVKAGTLFGTANIQLNVANIKVPHQDEPITLEHNWQLGIRPAYPAHLQRIQQQVLPDKPLTFEGAEIKALYPTTVLAQLSMSSYPAINVAAHFSALKAYPYGCLEQTTSGVYPQLQANDKVLQQLGIEGSPQQKRKVAIQKAIDRVLGMQRGDGSFGLWSNTSPEEPWLTAYVTDFLLQAQLAGYAVPKQALDNALERLKHYVQTQNLPQDNYPAATFATRAYSAWVLAQLRQAPLGTLRTYSSRYQDTTNAGLAWVQLGLALDKMGDSNQAQNAITKGVQQLRINENYYHSYGSRTRDLSLAIHWLEPTKQYSSLVRELAMLLHESLKNKQYFSTQERNALFLAGVSLRNHGETWSGELTLGQEATPLKNLVNLQQAYGYEQLKEGLTITTQDKRGLFATLDVTGYPSLPPKPVSNQLSIQRSFYSFDGKPLTLSSLQTGDLVIVRLQLKTEKPLRNVLVVNLLPAGLELENQNLATSASAEQLMINGTPISRLQRNTELSHQEYRGDRYVAALDMPYSNSQYELFFLARAVTPGTYQVPPAFVEAMYQPQYFSIGETIDELKVKSHVSADDPQ